jgi:hypothetical protein
MHFTYRWPVVRELLDSVLAQAFVIGLLDLIIFANNTL